MGETITSPIRADAATSKDRADRKTTARIGGDPDLTWAGLTWADPDPAWEDQLPAIISWADPALIIWVDPAT